MKAIAISPGQPGAKLIEVAEPSVTDPYQVKLKVIEVGICGTDREEVSGGRANAPEGTRELVIGHEVLCRVIETGPEVTTVGKGDFAVLTVRRGCGKCAPCKINRSDMCLTGQYTERGIKGRNGFEAEFITEDEQYVIKVPESIRSVAVLTEPMSITEKAISEALKIQEARLPKIYDDIWFSGRTALVAGIGAVGLLASIALRLRGAKVIGLDIVDEHSTRPGILKKLGGTYLHAGEIKVGELDVKLGQIDFIFEAAGIAQLGFDLIDALGINGIYAMTGIPGEKKTICIPGGKDMSQIVLKNQIIMGSVNASLHHFELAIKDLEKAKNKWGSLIDQLITTRVNYQDFEKALNFRSEDDIKTIITWE